MNIVIKGLTLIWTDTTLDQSSMNLESEEGRRLAQKIYNLKQKKVKSMYNELVGQ